MEKIHEYVTFYYYSVTFYYNVTFYYDIVTFYLMIFDCGEFEHYTKEFMNSALILAEKSCIKEQMKAKFMKEMSKYLDYLKENALIVENRQKYYYNSYSQKLADIIERIYSSAKLGQLKNENTGQIETSIIKFFLVLGKEIDLNDW